jgi:phosphinothricin acetyltransferase
VHIRLAESADAEAIAAIYTPIVERTHISFEERVPDVQEMRRRIAAHAGKYPWLVAIENGTLLGYAYAGAHRSRAAYRWSVDASVYVAEHARGHGIAKALYTELFERLKRQRFRNVFAGIALPNDPSIALHRSFGFTHVGVYRSVGYKLGAWRDTSWWQLRLTDDTAAPDEPLPPMANHTPANMNEQPTPNSEDPTLSEQPTTASEQPTTASEQPAAASEQPSAQPTNEERRARAQATWQRLASARTSGETIQATVKAPVKGGLLVDIEGYRGFLPASQVGVAKGTPIESLAGSTIPLKVLDVDEERKRLVVSHRRALQEDRRKAREELVRSLKIGEEREATVLRLADFGAFVDLGAGVDALIPVSELAFERVEKPSDVVHIGERLKVRVLRLENSGKKIAVSRKGAMSDPWRQHGDLLKQGKTIEGKVTSKDPRLEVEIAPGIVGSISDRDADPADYEIGETIEVTVRSVDFRGRRLRLTTPHSAASFTSTSFAPLGVELTKPPRADRT